MKLKACQDVKIWKSAKAHLHFQLRHCVNRLCERKPSVADTRMVRCDHSITKVKPKEGKGGRGGWLTQLANPMYTTKQMTQKTLTPMLLRGRDATQEATCNNRTRLDYSISAHMLQRPPPPPQGAKTNKTKEILEVTEVTSGGVPSVKPCVLTGLNVFKRIYPFMSTTSGLGNLIKY